MHPSKSINFACSPRPPRPSHTCRSLFLCRPRLSSSHLRSSFAFSWSSQRLILFLLSFSYRLQHSLDSSTMFPLPRIHCSLGLRPPSSPSPFLLVVPHVVPRWTMVSSSSLAYSLALF